ncbi:TetR/AcrR family transcriptional regulator [Maritalea porphyrae]|uniref:TetR/AcrR family transcriptional regulator n=1 Tax=Maritalea porphyrae TaxID=880732 RepID=UPI0022AF13BF|nr:TetR/AcrR family transcriptional regulator [Maritalea porphyrae]MCZ4273964.1 TetR/AcrR family transcriptional regulator [Maritalea porphyrae]
MPRPDRSKERIVQILGAAAKVFARDGVQGARMEDVAKEAGLSKAAIYLYYKNKDGLVLALLDQFFSANLDALKLIPIGENAAERICSWIDLVSAAMQQGAHFQTVGFEFLALAGRNEEARAVVLDFYQHYQSAIADLLVQDGVSPEMATQKAQEIVALLEGINLLWMAQSGKMDFAKLAKSGVRALLS